MLKLGLLNLPVPYIRRYGGYGGKLGSETRETFAAKPNPSVGQLDGIRLICDSFLIISFPITIVFY